MQLFSAVLKGWVHPADAFVAFFVEQANSFWLDREHNHDDRFSVIGAGVEAAIEGDWAEALSARIEAAQEIIGDALPFDWRPGLVGLITYEGEPRFIESNRAIVFDHAHRRLFFVGRFASAADFEAWHHAVLLRLGLVAGDSASYRHRNKNNRSKSHASLRHDSSNYLGMIETAQRHIAAGDVYQICLTNRIDIEQAPDPLDAYLELRKKNPAPYSAYFKLGNLVVVCSSPEQFLKVTADGLISTKPIKGTRPRGRDQFSDAAAAEELRSNHKERAENLMIVDLMRNDIGRVAQADSVNVPKLFEVESYATVHQLVSTVKAQLSEGKNSVDALQSAFPGGSMTGAPKLRAMQIIERLEQGPRGIYSGVIGYLGFDGRADFGMTIRTIVFEGALAYIGVGGGITSDSDPESELAETRLKAAALLAAIGANDPWV
ncbi:aminodeoxychorismate synthase component I [Rhodoluna sp.]|uniref:aminodeoxychorismate synthase component I n=1 Tax=Rhodoluna sp. TaxID=1969481 RepID=UPI0025F381FA|nr:aminodeoxychorismate synthase component I [Rhodoluna sp.]